jgi:iron complex transport system substrate-binding protein
MAEKNQHPAESPGGLFMVTIRFASLFCRLFLPLVLLSPGPVCGTVSVRYSHGFSVERQGKYTLISVNNPWPGARTCFHYLLKPRGTATPEGYKSYQVVETPIRRLVVLSTTHLAFIDSLNLVDHLVGFSDPERIITPSIRKAVAEGKIKKVGQGPNLQVETILDLEPDLVLTYGTGSFRDAHPKLLEAGLKVAINGEYMEFHPLGRAEWLKFVALFFNKGDEAEHLFKQLEQRYLELTTLTRNIRHRPTVVTGIPFSGRWGVAGGNSFIGHFLKDSGADYIWKDTDHTGSLPMDIELVYDRAVDAEFWINTGIWSTRRQVEQTDPRFLSFASLRSGNIYNRNRRINRAGGNDYWESGMIRPDLILADLIRILHPEILPDHQLFYYRKLQ